MTAKELADRIETLAKDGTRLTAAVVAARDNLELIIAALRDYREWIDASVDPEEEGWYEAIVPGMLNREVLLVVNMFYGVPLGGWWRNDVVAYRPIAEVPKQFLKEKAE